MLQYYSNSCPTVNSSTDLYRHSPNLAERYGLVLESVITIPLSTESSLIKRKLLKHTYYTLPPELFDLHLPTPLTPHHAEGLINDSRIRYEDVRDAIEFKTTQSEQASDYQYDHLTFYKGIAFLNEELRDYARNFVTQTSSPVNLIQGRNESIKDSSINKTVSISVKAIREITGYSPVPWQQELLKDRHPFVFVVGSRQIGKSFSVAELSIERSFVPNHRIMVASFVLNSTRAIRDYVLELTDKFGDVFTYYKKEEYILNTHTNSKIYFRTLSDEGRTVRGMKLDLAIIDEAAYVPNEIFERVIMPTVSTTNGQIISISSPDGRNWFFDFVMEAKKDVSPTSPYSLYEIDISKNPFISDTLRDYAYKNKHKKRIRQEYFCEFGTSADALYDPALADFFPPINPASPNEYLVIGYDPARKADRAGVTFLHVKASHNPHSPPITAIHSLAIPQQHKVTYEKQAAFIAQAIKEYGFPPDRTFLAMDVTGVGDVVFPIMKRHHPVHLTILYTSGNNSESAPDRTTYPGSLHFRTSKSLLVSNVLDLHDEETISVYEYTNQLLVEEITYLNRTTGKLGQIGFISSFYDDIFNSFMLAAYCVTKKGLLNKIRSESHENENESPFSDYPYVNVHAKTRRRSATF